MQALTNSYGGKSTSWARSPHSITSKNRARAENAVANSSKANRLKTKLKQFDNSSNLLSETQKQCYMQIVGSLQYVATVTRPNISFAASALARFMANPTNHLLKCAERVLKYLAGTKSHKLTYTKSRNLTMTGYSDADWANCETTRRSTSGIIVYFNESPIYWRSRRQKIVTMSSTEAEFVALTELSLQVIWL